jgi:hypothetical protein
MILKKAPMDTTLSFLQQDSSSRNTLTSLRFKHREYSYLPGIQGFKLQEYSYLPEIQAPGALDGVLKTVKAIGGHKPLYVKILNQLRTRISESY